MTLRITSFFVTSQPQEPRPPGFRGFEITLRQITLGKTPLDKRSVRRRGLYLTTHNTHKGQISLPPEGFEPTISAGER